MAPRTPVFLSRRRYVRGQISHSRKTKELEQDGSGFS